MRWFWLGVVALVALGGGLLLARGSGDERTSTSLPASAPKSHGVMDANPPTRPEELERVRTPRAAPGPVVELKAPELKSPEPEAPMPDVPSVFVHEEPEPILVPQPGPIVIEGAQESPVAPAAEQTQEPANEPKPPVAEPEASLPAPVTEAPVTPVRESVGPGTPDEKAAPAAENPNVEVPESADAPPKSQDVSADGSTTEAPAASGDAPTAPVAPAGQHAPLVHGSPAVDAAKPPSVVVRDDGIVMVDGRHAVKGKGTEESPYELPWEMLIDIRQVYDPRAGKTALPEWTKFFEGKVVKITGFLLLPLAGEEVDELLMMRNQWDGCCIGVPPTAYDAVEVKLSGVIRVSRFNVNYGSIVGDFKVDPYLSGKWLIGLYVMEDCLLRDTAGKNLIGT